MAAPIVEGCPAFMDGCPFKEISQTDGKLLTDIMATIPQEIFSKCPAFAEGCPFKQDESVEALYNRLCEMPPSHRIGQDTEIAKAVATTFKMVHEKSKELKTKLNVGGCTVFATSCPFKTITTHGEPLVQELDAIVVQWGLLEGDESQKKDQDQAADTPLSKSLKAGTRAVHRAAENVRFVRDFLKGVVPLDSYIELLKALYHVYTALESGLKALPAELKHCDFDIVRRTETLETDLRQLMGVAPGAKFEVGPPSPSAAAYVQRLERLMREQPFLVLAHAYTRYLGDLSGGQILARAASKAYALPAGSGTAFYKFERVGESAAETKKFKTAYRNSLDGLRLSADQADALVTEANTAFLMNMLLFEERDHAAGHLDTVRTLEEVEKLVESHRTPLGFQAAYGGKGGDTSKCPFLTPGPNEDGESKPQGVCPWPFVLLHAPRQALATHPRKNLAASVVLSGALYAAWKYPRATCAALFAGAPALWWARPRRQRSGPPPEKPAGH